MASGDTKTEAMLNALGNGGSVDEFRGCCNTKTQQYILDAIDRVQNVEDEVEELKNNPDVVDIVDTYADLQAYDKSTLTDKDIIRVLEDSTHSNKSTYYRYSASTDSFTYIGEAGGGVNVVQTPGNSQTDVMSQNATTSMVFADPSTQKQVKIGYGATVGSSRNTAVGQGATAAGTNSVAVGSNSWTNANYTTAVGDGATVSSIYSTAIGRQATTQSNTNSVAIGYYASTSRNGEVNIGTQNGLGYSSTSYRVLGGVHDPVDAHDAATKGYVDSQGGGVTPVQATGTSTTDVMSQDAITKMVYPKIATSPNAINIRGTSGIDTATAEYAISIGTSSIARGERAVSIGFSTQAYDNGDRSVSIGNFAKVNNNSKGIAIGNLATCSNPYSIALGSSATTSRTGEVNIGAGTSGEGYNSTNYRVIGGVHDGQLAQDAVTVNQVNSVIDAINTALSTNIPHIGA